MSLSDEAIRSIEEGDDGETLLFMEPRVQYDPCILGVAQRYTSWFLVYDRECVLDAIRADIAESDDSDEDPSLVAEEHFSFNVVGGWVGEGTPAFLSSPKDLAK